MNCRVLPIRILAEAGVTAIDTSRGEVIVNVAMLEVIPEKLAVTVVVPSVREAVNPFEPDVLLMVATVLFDKLQLTEDVKSCVVWSV